MNFQDVIRDVHDPTTHTLQTSGGATIFAVVNTGSPGVGESIVTINPRKDYIGLVSVSGNVDVGLPTVTVGNETLYAVVNTPSSTATVDIRNTINANVSLSDSISNIGFATVSVSNPTLYAVVNTTAASGVETIFVGTPTLFAVVNTGAVASSNVTLDPGSQTQIVGNVTLDDGSLVGLNAGLNGIGFATVAVSTPTLYSVVNVPSTVGISAGVAGIGFATVNLVNQPALVASSAYVGLVTAVNGLAWPDPKTYIGLTSVSGTVGLAASTLNIGSVSVLGGGIGINAGVNGIGFATVKIDTGTKYIGLVTANIGTTKAWADPNTFIGLVTVAPHALTASTVNIGSVSILGGGIGINAGVNNIGFATVTLSPAGNPSVFAVNVGTNKTLINLPIAFSAASVVTVAVPTNANTMKITNMLLNSDATVRFTMKSGVTYLTGNASIGITLNPGGGFIMTGSPDSPSWIGLPSGALVIEKLDLTGTSAKMAGNVVYWQE